jgi:hypothetical protein
MCVDSVEILAPPPSIAGEISTPSNIMLAFLYLMAGFSCSPASTPTYVHSNVQPDTKNPDPVTQQHNTPPWWAGVRRGGKMGTGGGSLFINHQLARHGAKMHAPPLPEPSKNTTNFGNIGGRFGLWLVSSLANLENGPAILHWGGGPRQAGWSFFFFLPLSCCPFLFPR